MSQQSSEVGLDSRLDLRRRSGVRNDSNLKSRRNQVVEPLQLGRIGQIARSDSNIAAATRWYTEVLGLKHLYSFGNMAFFECNGTRLFLSEGDSASNSIIYFLVPDVHQAHDRLADRGVEFINAPHIIHRHEDGTEEHMAFFKDNEGRPLAVMAQVPTA